MTETFILITGANGEIGHGLIHALVGKGEHSIIALDLHPIDEKIARDCAITLIGDILDPEIIAELEKYPIRQIFHLAALLSTSSEKMPTRAHDVNVNGTLGLLEMAQRIGKRDGVKVKFLFPSSIAVYGIPTLEEKASADKVKEDEWNSPATMYGVNKLYCEHLGRYYSNHYKRLGDEPTNVDFRALRFPGLISADTIPTGGTSDYAPEMLHAAAQNKPNACFVRESSKIPFMAMPDGTKALLMLAAAPQSSLSRTVYNIGAFAPTAGEIAEFVKKAFPNAEIMFEPSEKRQGIVDSWCADVDDSAARKDWGWQEDFGFERSFTEYLIPKITEHYRGK